jgi:hypothetical protein
MYIFYIAIVVILYIYISYYYRYSEEPTIIHSYEKLFQNNVMLEKRPIILLENEKSLEEIHKKNTPYMIKKKLEYDTSNWVRNKYKYLYIQPTDTSELHLLQASKKLTEDGIPDKDETLITLKVKKNQIIILPYHWYYYTETPINSVGVHDYISWILP